MGWYDGEQAMVDGLTDGSDERSACEAGMERAESEQRQATTEHATATPARLGQRKPKTKQRQDQAKQ